MLHSLEMLQAGATSVPGPPRIGPLSSNGELKIYTGTCGGTALSMQRRAHDSRFATRYFVGHGLDVGGGHDSLALYVELFPLIRNVVIYDAPQGDAQKLDNVDDACFDFLFSSHCLEHVRDPAEALANWIRVIKPGGHLVISVPDEDLYEQGVWPSTFNGDHKLTFTLSQEDVVVAGFGQPVQPAVGVLRQGEAAEHHHHRSCLSLTSSLASIRRRCRCRSARSSSC